MPRRRARLTAAVASLSALVGLLAVGGAGATSAAWTDAAVFAAPANGGTWVTTPVSPITPGTGVQVAVTWTKDDNAYNAIQVCAQVVVSTTSATPVAWEFVLNLGVAPWNGVTTGYQIQQGNATWSYDGHVVRVDGTSDPNQAVSAGHPRTILVCNYNLVPIPAGSSSGDYTVTASHGTWTTGTACVVTTIRGTGASQFYANWSATVDMTDAFARVAPVGRVAQADAWGVSITPAPSPSRTTYALTSQVAGWAAGAVAGTGTYVVTLCAYDN